MLLREAEHKNLHMTHVDELPILTGAEGADIAIQALRRVFDKVTSSAPVEYNVKWDGAPAVYAGWDPETGEFIMALKALFAKSPKIIRQMDDVETFYSDKPELADKMRAMWSVLSGDPQIPQGQIWQGDFLYAAPIDLFPATIGGESFITFHPNTI
ncbi:MAG: hypothetical protein LC650_04435, partial [Actinobacteria bacterium]|nr:hypothetical protein [Actinomycetota bacterium]